MSTMPPSQTEQQARPRTQPRVQLRRLLPSVALNGGVPLLLYALLRPHVSSDVTALAIAGAVPVVLTVAELAWRRRLDVFGVIAVAGFGVVLLLQLLSGGNALLLKLQDSVVTGPLGLLCLGSVAVRRPLHLLVLLLLATRKPELTAVLEDPARRRTSMVFTALVGSTLFVHALAMLVLAVTLPTTTFLALSRPVGWAVLGIGVVCVYWYRKRLPNRPATAQPNVVATTAKKEVGR
ncbi:VC0807 family protein [Actinopolymorpha pittospori]